MKNKINKLTTAKSPTKKVIRVDAIVIFFVAALLRLSFFFMFTFYYSNPTHFESDANAHYLTSINLEVPKEQQDKIGYKNWYERTPLAVFFFHITHRNIFILILISSLTVVILYGINHLAGWLWCFYPQAIILSFQFNKETLLWFVLASLIYIAHWYSFRLSSR